MDDQSEKLVAKVAAGLLATGSRAVVAEEEIVAHGGLWVDCVERVATVVVEAKQGEAVVVRVGLGRWCVVVDSGFHGWG